MALLSNTFSSGTAARASEVNANFSAIANELAAFPTNASCALKDGAVSTAAKIANGIITSDKLNLTTIPQLKSELTPSDPKDLAPKKYVDDKIAASVYCQKYDGTKIKTSATPPVAAEDLDLKSLSSNFNSDIGTARALVTLKVIATNTSDLWFRNKDDSSYQIGFDSSSRYGGGTSACTLKANGMAYIYLMTDSSGVIQWMRGNGTASYGAVDIYLMTYQKVR